MRHLRVEQESEGGVFTQLTEELPLTTYNCTTTECHRMPQMPLPNSVTDTANIQVQRCSALCHRRVIPTRHVASHVAKLKTCSLVARLEHLHPTRFFLSTRHSNDRAR